MSAEPPPPQAQPWRPEREVDAELALALIQDAFPALDARSVTPFLAGWDNTVWLVDDIWVFRFPRRQIAVDLLSAEARVLPAIASHLPLPVPIPEHLGQPTGRFPWPFVGYRLLKGRTACRAALDDIARAALAEPLARFLSVLHTLPAGVLHAAAPPADTLDRLAIPRRATAAVVRLEEAAHHGLIPAAAPWLDLLAELPESWQPRTDRLVHGDLYARHVLVDDENRAAGIIDWGDAHLGDPALDLSIAYSFLRPDARRRFFDVYEEACGELGETTHRMARFKALISGVTILVYGHDIGDADLVREGTIALEHLREA